MHFNLIFISAATIGCCVACDGGMASSDCPTDQVECNGVCQPVTYYCASTHASGGATAATTQVVYSDTSEYSNPNCTDQGSSTGKFTTDYGGTSLNTTTTGKNYYIHTNWWHLYDGQVVTYQGLSFTVNNPKGVASEATDGNPMGYPSIFIGSYSGHTTTGSNLPRQVSALSSVPTVFSTNAIDMDFANHNASYDVWFTDTSQPLASDQYAPPKGGAYLMVWMYKPTSRQPRGSERRHNVTIAGVDGTWNVWVDPSTPPCISYVSSTPRNGLSFDLNAFIQDSVSNKHGITSSMYLSVVFGGLEIWGGADGVKVKNFCVNVQ